jgi:hypothetical protein
MVCSISVRWRTHRASTDAPSLVVIGLHEAAGPAVAQAGRSFPGMFPKACHRTYDVSRVAMRHVRRRGAKTDNFPTARQLLLHLDSQVAHAAFAQ